MKRLASFLLLVVLIFGFAGCEKKTPQKGQNEVPAVVATPVTATTPKAEVKPVEKEEILQTEKNEEKYIGNKNTHKFHRTSCKVLPKEKNRVYLKSKEEAKSKYYKSCQKCNP